MSKKKLKILSEHEVDIICQGLDMVREEREDELDIIVNAIRTPDPEKAVEIKASYEARKVEAGIFISKLKSKVKKLK